MVDTARPNVDREAMEARVGSTVAGKYRLLRVLGVGGMGAVFEAENAWTERRVALKLMLGSTLRDEEMVARFLREARSASKIHHPNIVDVLDMGRDESDGSLFIAQEFLVGHDLRSALARRGAFSPEEAIQIIAPVMSALITAHRVGIVHRDIKPENIFLAKGVGGTVTPKVIDFGIAKVVDGGGANHSLTRTGAPMGTPNYMSPEQAKGERDIDHQSDIWSLGVVFYEMLCGRPLWAADNFHALLFAIAAAPIARIDTVDPRVPSALADVIHHALQRERTARYQTMKAFLSDLLDSAHFAGTAWHENLRITHRSALDHPGAGDASDAFENATAVRVGSNNPPGKHSSPPPAHIASGTEATAATMVAGSGAVVRDSAPEIQGHIAPSTLGRSIREIPPTPVPVRRPIPRFFILGGIAAAILMTIGYRTIAVHPPAVPPLHVEAPHRAAPVANVANLPPVTPAPRSQVASDDIDGLLAHGLELRLQGRNEAAFDEFRRAYDGSHRPIARAQMGLTAQALGRWIDAARDLRGAMVSDQDPAVHENREALEASYRLVRQHLGVIEVRSGTPGAEVWINGDRIGSLPLDDALHLLPGTVALEVRAPGFTPVTRQVTVAAGESRTLMIELPPAAQ